MIDYLREDSIIIDTPEGIRFYHMAAQLGAMKMELHGLHHSSGRSIIAYVKKQYNLKGSKESVVKQFAALVEGELK